LDAAAAAAGGGGVKTYLYAVSCFSDRAS